MQDKKYFIATKLANISNFKFLIDIVHIKKF